MAGIYVSRAGRTARLAHVPVTYRTNSATIGNTFVNIGLRQSYFKLRHRPSTCFPPGRNKLQ
ncbi:MAG: hypothetical protein JWL69_2048 [Phycisphaerales bacterium]|nr:hypothetical protein [Phycisphaerales bacterium]